MNEREHVLIIDDAPANIRHLAEILGAHYRVTFALNGEDGLEAARGRSMPSLIMLDVMMPGMDGYEVCRRLKADLRTADIPVIFLTAQSDVSDEERGLKLGAVDYLHKPSHPAIVLQRVRLHLKLHNQNLALEDRVRERTQELDETRLEIVRRLGRAAEYKDNETGTHVIRMSHYCHRLALAAGIPAAQAELIHLAAPMHDVGKIGIPDRILLKPGKLDDAEWAIMKEHARIGADIIGEHEGGLLAVARTIALTHHEQWNGGGYPHGLAGEAIPIEGRIASIADVYDALVSERPYKAAWSSDDAAAEIIRGSGRAFDPNLVALFIALRPEFRGIWERYADPARATELAISHTHSPNHRVDDVQVRELA